MLRINAGAAFQVSVGAVVKLMVERWERLSIELRKAIVRIVR